MYRTLTKFKQRIENLASFTCPIESQYPEIQKYNDYARRALSKFLTNLNNLDLLLMARESFLLNQHTCIELRTSPAVRHEHPREVEIRPGFTITIPRYTYDQVKLRDLEIASNEFAHYHQAMDRIITSWHRLNAQGRLPKPKPKVRMQVRRKSTGLPPLGYTPVVEAILPPLVIRYSELQDIESQLNDAALQFERHELEARLPEILYNL